MSMKLMDWFAGVHWTSSKHIAKLPLVNPDAQSDVWTTPPPQFRGFPQGSPNGVLFGRVLFGCQTAYGALRRVTLFGLYSTIHELRILSAHTPSRY